MNSMLIWNTYRTDSRIQNRIHTYVIGPEYLPPSTLIEYSSIITKFALWIWPRRRQTTIVQVLLKSFFSSVLNFSKNFQFQRIFNDCFVFFCNAIVLSLVALAQLSQVIGARKNLVVAQFLFKIRVSGLTLERKKLRGAKEYVMYFFWQPT